MRPVPKPPKPWCSEKYRKLIDTKPCLRCGGYNMVTHHHCRELVRTGASTKPGDQFMIPLCSALAPGETMSCHDKEQQFIEPLLSDLVKLDSISNTLNEFLNDRLPKG
jgi:hypothetical protein